MAPIKPGSFLSIGYANIIFSVFIGMALGDAFPDWMSLARYLLYHPSGVIISLCKQKNQFPENFIKNLFEKIIWLFEFIYRIFAI